MQTLQSMVSYSDIFGRRAGVIAHPGPGEEPLTFHPVRACSTYSGLKKWGFKQRSGVLEDLQRLYYAKVCLGRERWFHVKQIMKSMEGLRDVKIEIIVHCLVYDEVRVLSREHLAVGHEGMRAELRRIWNRDDTREWEDCDVSTEIYVEGVSWFGALRILRRH